MNCKQGDLAIIINDPDFDGRDCGKIVKIIRAAPDDEVGPCWECHAETPMICEEFSSGEVSISNFVDIPDSWLKPVSGLQMTDFIDKALPILEAV